MRYRIETRHRLVSRNSPRATLFVTLAAWETGEPSIDKLLLRHEIRRPMSCKGTRPARVPIRRASRLLARGSLFLLDSVDDKDHWTTNSRPVPLSGRGGVRGHSGFEGTVSPNTPE